MYQRSEVCVTRQISTNAKACACLCLLVLSSSLTMTSCTMKSHAHFHAHPRTKHYLPLESNPDVFTNLIKALGVSSLRFTDVYSLSEPDLLKMVPRPVLGLVLVLPTNDAYQQWVTEKEAERKDYVGKGDAEDVVWFKQTIGNACGLYAILHALCNGTAQGLLRMFSDDNSILIA